MALKDFFKNIPVVGPLVEKVALPIIGDVLTGGKRKGKSEGTATTDTSIGAPFFNQSALNIKDIIALSGSSGRSSVQQFRDDQQEQIKWFQKVQGSRGFDYINKVIAGQVNNTYVSPGNVKAAQTFKKKKTGPTIKTT